MIITEKKKKITGPDTIAKIMYSILETENEIDQDKEHFWVVGLNGNNVIQYIELSTLGILNKCMVHPREVFRFAIMKGINSIILAHNHPSGNLLSSNEDDIITNTLKESGKILGIAVLDHIIIGSSESNREYYSYQENGLIGAEV